MNIFVKQATMITLGLISGFSYFHFSDTADVISCSNAECYGHYKGAEFIEGSDIAHQFSNKMSAKVGDKLKELFKSGEYSKVDFDHIIMTTKGMGSGNVIYSLKIPFKRVSTRCEAYTSFDHVGGWNHAPALDARKKQLEKALMANQELDISELKVTAEGLQEYWVQWRNKISQAMCE
jgi:hypothetical protein